MRLSKAKNKADPFPEEFIVTKSDPQAPSKFRDLKVYESNNNLYLEGYGGKNSMVGVSVFNNHFTVQAGKINDGTIINFKEIAPSRQRTTDAVMEIIKTHVGKSKVILRDGTVFNDVTITDTFSDNMVIFFPYIMNETIPLSEMADTIPIK